MSGKSAAKPLCGECENGLRYDESGDEPVVTRCPCRFVVLTPAQARDDAMQATAHANPNAARAAYLIVKDAALANETVSANSVRHAMIAANIPGPVIGNAFRQAARDGLIKRDGYVPSSQVETHGHPVAQWRSRVYRKAAS